MTAPDPKTISEFAREVVRSHAQDIERMSVGEMMSGDPRFDEVTEDEFDDVEGAVRDLGKLADAWLGWFDSGQDGEPPSMPERRIEIADHLGRVRIVLNELKRLGRPDKQPAEATGGEQAQDGAASEVPPPFVTALTDSVIATMQPVVAMSVRHLLASRSVWRAHAYRSSAERDAARQQLAAATERAALAEAQAAEVQAERNEWQRRAQRGHVVAEILRADLAAATVRAEKAEAEAALPRQLRAAFAAGWHSHSAAMKGALATVGWEDRDDAAKDWLRGFVGNAMAADAAQDGQSATETGDNEREAQP